MTDTLLDAKNVTIRFGGLTAGAHDRDVGEELRPVEGQVHRQPAAHGKPGDRAALFEPSNDKVYRHPTFFPMPEEVKHI